MRRERGGVVTLFTHLLFPPSCPAVRKCRKCNAFFNMVLKRVKSWVDCHSGKTVPGWLPQSQHMDGVDVGGSSQPYGDFNGLE